MSNQNSKTRRTMLLLMGIGLGLILIAALSYLADNPSLVQHTQSRNSVQQAPVSQEQASDGVTGLMRRLQESPNDMDALTALAQHFMHTQDWDKAETFALRAVLSAPGDPKPLYTLGIIQHSTGRNAEAAASLEKALAMKFDPSIGYSLGILYAYYLNEPDKGLAYLRAILEFPESPADLRNSVLEDIRKIEEHKKHSQAAQ